MKTNADENPASLIQCDGGMRGLEDDMVEGALCLQFRVHILLLFIKLRAVHVELRTKSTKICSHMLVFILPAKQCYILMQSTAM